MPAPSPLPLYVYKILPEAPPSPLPDELPLSALDAKDGFIHLSTAWETPATASWFYSHAKSIWLLKIPLTKIEGGVKWEEARSGFAHLYGKGLRNDEITETKEYRRSEKGDWYSLLKNDTWLS
ncbi:hypothetical protein P7C71_g415, partial [Lecanoromycetidae sp. Uapishka_2]